MPDLVLGNDRLLYPQIPALPVQRKYTTFGPHQQGAFDLGLKLFAHFLFFNQPCSMEPAFAAGIPNRYCYILVTIFQYTDACRDAISMIANCT